MNRLIYPLVITAILVFIPWVLLFGEVPDYFGICPITNGAYCIGIFRFLPGWLRIAGTTLIAAWIFGMVWKFTKSKNK